MLSRPRLRKPMRCSVAYPNGGMPITAIRAMRPTYLALQAGGCFCEMLPQEGGSIEHMRVVYARPGAALRLQGGLGPLQAEAVTGTLSWTFKAVEGETEIVQNYAVAGHVRTGMEKLAVPVDRVMAEQLARLRDRLNGSETPVSR
jgi:hypothetical protein